jgi:hypothetical protein
MMEQRPTREFGKRMPTTAIPARPVKRSGHVALLLMGSVVVGGGAYALIPEACEPISPGMAAPATPQAGCASHGTSGGGGSRTSSRVSFFGGGSSTKSLSAAPSDSAAGGATRGGFGSFARAFGFSGG